MPDKRVSDEISTEDPGPTTGDDSVSKKTAFVPFECVDARKPRFDELPCTLRRHLAACAAERRIALAREEAERRVALRQQATKRRQWRALEAAMGGLKLGSK